ncbi:hypothetical protein K488DRAFT_90586 [Vararia minispora EC-137]|uniref:Uncharacterized protein n=1 Tax=Vararia minispora EC-137 TaxID=1314806 RepID=A0ACB8Q797_9AGAM|nr:hypothetical protein K488DRAFT_90586 [Vararia minispora EC-137]
MSSPSRRRFIPLPSRPPSLSADSLRSLHHQLSSFLDQTLSDVNQHASEYPRATVYTGLAGPRISLLNHSLAPFFPHLTSRQTAYTQLVLALKSDQLRTPSRGSKAGFLDTSVGPATLVLYYQLMHYVPASASVPPPFSQKECHWCARLLHDAISCATRDEDGEPPEYGCELLYGRAGLLYALLLLRQAMPTAALSSPNNVDGIEALLDLVRPLTRTATLKVLVDDIVRRGRIGAVRFNTESRLTDGPSLMWTWHSKRYLGAAHGVGILYVILHAPESLVIQHADVIAQTITHILFLQDPAGNWPSAASVHLGGPKSNDLVQWCHGATGMIPLLAAALSRSQILKLTPDMRSAISSSLERAAALVHGHGLLRKGPGLCHGAAGSAAALFLLADCKALPQEARQRYLWHGLHLAICMAELAPRRAFMTADRPWSLFEGAAGTCAAVACVVGRLDALLGTSRAGEGLRGGLLGCADLITV